MIVSHSHKLVFVEFPQTGCSAVARELMKNYGGERKLFKHALYREFLKCATDEEKKYFSFSTVRNPMDIVVSKFFKYKTDHENYKNKKVKHGKLRRFTWHIEQYRRNYITSHDAGFEQFFMKFYRLPYSSWSLVDHDRLDFVMQFENLTDSFEEVLQGMGIKPVRKLPIFNKTAGKKKHFLEYYEAPEVRRRAVKVFGPYMNHWGYSFPESWDEVRDARPSNMMYESVNVFRKFYWKHLR